MGGCANVNAEQAVGNEWDEKIKLDSLPLLSVNTNFSNFDIFRDSRAEWNNWWVA